MRRVVIEVILLLVVVAGLTAGVASGQPRSLPPGSNWEEVLESLVASGKVDADLAQLVSALYDGGAPDTYVPVFIILHGPPEIWEDALLTELPDARVVREYPFIPAIYARIRASEVMNLSEECWVGKMVLNVISAEPYVEISEIADRAMAAESYAEEAESAAESCAEKFNDALSVAGRCEKLVDDLMDNLSRMRTERNILTVTTVIFAGMMAFAFYSAKTARDYAKRLEEEAKAPVRR